jgi:hypothetical protein
MMETLESVVESEDPVVEFIPGFWYKHVHRFFSNDFKGILVSHVFPNDINSGVIDANKAHISLSFDVGILVLVVN